MVQPKNSNPTQLQIAVELDRRGCALKNQDSAGGRRPDDIERLLEKVKRQESEIYVDVSKIKKLLEKTVRRKANLSIALRMKRRNVRHSAENFSINNEMIHYVLENHVPLEYQPADRRLATATPMVENICVKPPTAATSDIHNLKASLENLENTLSELKRQVERDELALAHWENVVENPPTPVSPTSASFDSVKMALDRPTGSFQTLLGSLLFDENMWIQNMVQLMQTDSASYPGPVESRRAVFGQFSILIDRYKDLRREHDDLESRFAESSRLFDSVHNILPSRLESRDRLLRASRYYHDELSRENQSRQRFYGRYTTHLTAKYELPRIGAAFSDSLADLYNWVENEIERVDHLQAAMVLRPSSRQVRGSLAEIDAKFHEKATQMRLELETLEDDLKRAKLINVQLHARIETALSKPPKKKTKVEDTTDADWSQIPDKSCLQDEIILEKELMNKTLHSVQKLRIIVDKQHEENARINQLLTENYDKVQVANKISDVDVLSRLNELGEFEENLEKLKKMKREITIDNLDLQATKENLKRLKHEVAVRKAKLEEPQNFLSQSNRCINDLKLYTKQIGEQKCELEQYLSQGEIYNCKLEEDLRETYALFDKLKEKFRRLKMR